MQPKDVVKKAFNFEETKAIPYHIPIDEEIENKLDKYYGTREKWQDRMIPYIHGTMCGHKRVPIDGSDEVVKDPFGVVMKQGNILHVIDAPLKEPSLQGYRWPEAEELDDYEAIRKDLEAHPESYRWSGLAFGLFERSWLLRGMENLLVDLIENPSFVEDLLDGILEVHIKTMDLVAKELPVDIYFSGDDWCDQRGPIMGKELFRKFYKPRLKILLDHCHSSGLRFVAHSCGNVLSIVDDLMEAGLDGLESLQPEAMDIFELKRRTEKKMLLLGGVGTQSILPFGTPEEIRTMVDSLKHEMGKNGGYILGPAKPVMKDVPIENAVAFLEAAWTTDDRD